MSEVPPLQCESSGSSAEGSSGEEAGPLGGSHASPYASELSDPHPPDDDGYEADVEAGKLADKLAGKLAGRDLAHTASVLGGLPGERLRFSHTRLVDARRVLQNEAHFSDYQSPMEALCGERAAPGPALAHPELCLVVVDILSQLVQRWVPPLANRNPDVRIDELVVCVRVVEEESNNGTQESLERVCGGLARALAARLAGGGAPAGLLRRLLAPPAAALLRRTDPRLAELQHSILELIHVVASQSVEPRELAALLRLAAADRPPLGALLSALRRLLAHADPCTPDFALQFPLPLHPRSSDGESPLKHQKFTIRLVARNRSLVATDARAPCGAGAARCTVDGANWGPWLQGFALVLWLQPLPEAKCEDYDEVDRAAPMGEEAEETKEAVGERGEAEAAVHVLSLGQDSLTFELWLNVATGVPSVRLSRGVGVGVAECGGGGARALCEGSAACRLRAARWSCLALNVREAVLRRKIHIQASWCARCRRRACRWGRWGGAGAAWRLGPLALYRAPVLSAPAALHLAAHGPDHACQVMCEEPNYSAILRPDVLDMNVDWEQVFEIPAAALRELHDQLLATYSAHAHDHVNLYQQVSAPQTVSGFSGRGGGCAGSGVADTLRVQWKAEARVQRHRGFAPALLLLGGPEILLYLFARVVEAGGCAEQQAAALGVALRAGRADARLHAALYARDALQLLLPVLAAPSCRVSHHMLKEILDVACTGSLLSVSGQSVRLAARADCALREPRLLLLLLRAWPHLHTVQVSWEVEGGEVTENGSLWALALEAICALLRDGPRRAFNQHQAARAHLLRHLLLACKERFLNSDSGPLSTSASNSLVELVRALVGTPPLPAHLALLCDFLLLMHQASDTFVTHSRANFYFLLTAESPESSEFNFLTFINKRKNKQHKLRRSLERLALNDPPEGVESSEGTEGAEGAADDTHRAHNTKHMKGLINAHIRDSRKENGAAAQTNGTPVGASDAVGEVGEVGEVGAVGSASGGGGAEALSGYVLVDEDELRHTTVELYTGGIYHQRRVRAGAEPGWTACAGLLLLLRDSLAALPDHLLAQTVCGPVLAESLVVLANHRTACVRAAVVRCVCALQRRAPRALAATATAAGAHYYAHLADQISLYPGSWELATACAALLTKCDVPLEDQLDDDIWVELGEEAAQRGAPLLALLPACLHSVPLAHNVALLLRRLVVKVSLKALTDVALAEVVVRAVRDVGRMDEEFEGRDLLLEDLYDLLNKVAVKALASNHTMQSAVDIHQQLRYVAGGARGRGAAGVRRLARAAEAALFAAQLDHLEAHLDHCYATHNKHTNYFANGASGSGEQRAKWWAGWGAECAAQLQELFWWAASPAAGARALQPALLRALYRAPRAALAHLAPKDPTGMHKVRPRRVDSATASHFLSSTSALRAFVHQLSAYLLIMLQHVHAAGDAGGAGVELAITDWARDATGPTQAGLPERMPCDALPAEAERFLAEDEERWTKASTGPRQRAAVGKAVFTREGLAARCTESAMAVTRRVVEAQNCERKQFLEHLRRAHAAAALAAARWRRLIDTHTHERGVWHNPSGWPAAWQLDSTEGPGRIRVRLRRAHLRIPARCFQPHARYKAEVALQPGPLRSVLGPLLSGARHGGLAARLQPTESVAFMARVHHVTVDRETSGELLLSDRCIHFVPEWCGEAGEVGEAGGEGGEGEGESCAAQSWALGSVARVCPRRWCLQERAAELFLLSGHAHLLAFAATAERDAFLRALDAAHLPNRTEQESLSDVMNQWRNGTITNWEYLMALNGLAGRSYNDLMQYPVLPFIIADYTSKMLDLHEPASFRDLSKPMAVQNKKREQHYINTYNDLKAARREGCSPLLSRQPHHYASLYSNSGGVLHYLVRVPPFTELFLNYQDNNFDMPDRTFHSLATTWRLITHDSPTDVKELIPELFYLPEMFYNDEGDTVQGWSWACGSAARASTRWSFRAGRRTRASSRWRTGRRSRLRSSPSACPSGQVRTRTRTLTLTTARSNTPQVYPLHVAFVCRQTEVMAGVSGVRWGRYCGSPELGAPAVAARRQLAAAARLVPLPAPHVRAAAACAHHCAPLPYEEGPGGGAGGGLALLTWGHADGALRLRTRRDAAPVPLLHLPPLERVTQVSTCCTVGSWSWPAFVGLSSGRVLALRPAGTTGGAGARCSVRQLLAHRAPIAALCVCARATLLVSADTTGLLLLWDLNRLSYIRTLPNRERLPVTQVAVSETLSDVASVHELQPAEHTPRHTTEHTAECAEAAPEDGEADGDAYERDAPHKYQSLIRVHTVNGRFVGSVKVSEVVTCICYSNAPEGASVNCIAAGLRSGEVRLYSSWDLQLVRTLPAPQAAPAPLLSLSYSEDSLVLFAAHAGGLLLAWEAPHARAHPPRIVLATALL
ncbi:Lysosomal-trafficking regulator [Papilio xuthus]|uniref:Lysosomal-trafficking regulator n=1 Tax=Papilio xuthus TaxID=66420 RepID=A0A194PVV7_PAPXU|nr:Lysosomal-trafficking regulator [Papilio xuthus]